MIVAKVVHTYPQPTYISMRKVDTRRDAFFEMRRFCAVNGICGHRTKVDTLKTIDGFACDLIDMDGADFILFYLDSAEVPLFKGLDEYPVECRARDGEYSSTNYRKYRNPDGTNRAMHKYLFWHDELSMYFTDLKNRMKGGG